VGRVSPEYKVSVAAVRGNVDEVVTAMKRIGADNEDMPASNYEQWPVFYGVRNDQRFKEAFKAVFGVDYVPSATKQAGIAQVMEFIKETKAEMPTDIEGEIESSEISIQPQAEANQLERPGE
jgi:hypothetical protein